MRIETEQINSVFDIAARLEYINYEYDKLRAAMTAFVDFTGMYDRQKRFSDMQCRAEHFEKLFNIVDDYADAIMDALTTLQHQVYDYDAATRRAANQ